MDLDEQRRLFETLDSIEDALTARILKNPGWIPYTYKAELGSAQDSDRRLSPRDSALRRIEAGKLVDEYVRVHRLLASQPSAPASLDLSAELARVTDSVAPAEFAGEQFALLSGERGRRRLCSKFTEDAIKEVDKYPANENFGTTVYLEPFYNRLMATDARQKPDSYLNYLENFDQYMHGDSELRDYLQGFHTRALRIGSVCAEAAVDPLFCQACNKLFAKETVLSAHLQGKKHIKNAARAQSAVSVPALSIESLYADLKPAFLMTIANLKRKAGMTTRERQLEVDALEREREIEDSWVSEDEHEEENLDEAQRPLVGPEGTPIPRWLFRLQGLRNWYTCEICGPNTRFQGRKNFDRHFSDPKDQRHVLGLRKLGITMSLEPFVGVCTVAEAQRLHKLLRRGHQGKLDKEVEDDEGNVMSERMYNDLKKQGLL